MNTSSFHEITAVITAGGQSSRFGSDKAVALLNGQTLLWHVAESLRNYPRKILIAPADKYVLPDWEIIPDQCPGQGPLAGLETALIHAQTKWVAFAGVDMPGLTPEYWTALTDARTSDALAVQAVLDEKPQPLAALYHVKLLPHITEMLNQGERRLRLAAPPESTVLVGNLPAKWLININKPEDLIQF